MTRSKTNTIARTCEGCGGKMPGNDYRSRFCSIPCGARHRRIVMSTPDRVAFRMAAGVAKGDAADACWLWTGGQFPNGYGKIKIAGKCRYTHRVAWELAQGPIPEGLNVCHDCPTGDTKLCCNPSHMFLGSQADNVADRDAKGRTSRGIRHWNARLTEQDVRTIRERFATGHGSYASLGQEFGVTDKLIGMIVRRTSWKHVD